MSEIRVVTCDDLAKRILDAEDGPQMKLLLETARLCLRAGNKEKAIQLISRRLENIKKWKYSFEFERYTDHVDIANFFAEGGDFDKAKEIVSDVSDKIENYKANEWWLGVKIKTLTKIAHIYHLIGKDEEAISYLKMAYETAKDWMTGAIDKAESLFKIACGYEEMGKVSEADNMLGETMQVTDEKVKGENSKISLLSDCAVFLYARNNKKDQKTAIEIMKSASPFVDALRVESTKVNSILELASKYEAINERKKALALIERAFAMVKSMEEQYYQMDRMRGFSHLAYSYSEVEEKKKAEELLSMALTIAEEEEGKEPNVSIKVEIAGVYSEAAITYVRIGHIEKALKLVDKITITGREDFKFKPLIEIARTYLH